MWSPTAVQYVILTSIIVTETPLKVLPGRNNGCTLNCGDTYNGLKAVLEGLISEETITKAVEKLFESFRLGMFDEDCVYNSIPYDVVECSRHQEINKAMADESIVLLKNDGILPLDNTKNIAVIGPNADNKSILLANYNGTPTEYYTLLGNSGSIKGKVLYAKGCHFR